MVGPGAIRCRCISIAAADSAADSAAAAGDMKVPISGSTPTTYNTVGLGTHAGAHLHSRPDCYRLGAAVAPAGEETSFASDRPMVVQVRQQPEHDLRSQTATCRFGIEVAPAVAAHFSRVMGMRHSRSPAP